MSLWRLNLVTYFNMSHSQRVSIPFISWMLYPQGNHKCLSNPPPFSFHHLKKRMHMWCLTSLPLKQRGYPYSLCNQRIYPCSYSRRLLCSLSNLEEFPDFLSNWEFNTTSLIACLHSSTNYLNSITIWLPISSASLYQACFLSRYHGAISTLRSCNGIQVISLSYHFHFRYEDIALSLSTL